MKRKPSLSVLSRLARWTATLAGAGLAAAAPAQARSVDPAAAPVEWVRYAQSVTTAVTGWLQADSEPAIRLRAYLDGTRPAADQPTAPLLLKLWIDRDGAVSRIDFTPFAHPEPNADLRSLIVGQHLTASPPPDMLLPLRIAVQLDAPVKAPPQSEPLSEPRRLPRGTPNRT